MAHRNGLIGRLRMLIALATMLLATACGNGGAAPPARALPCSLGRPPGTAADAERMSLPLVRWHNRYDAAFGAACD